MKSKSYRLLAAVCVIGLLSFATTVRAKDIDYQPLSLSVEAGTTGLGGSLAWRFSDHLGLRAGGNFLDYDFSPEIEGVDYDVNLKLQSIPVGIDIFTSKKSSFRITLGAFLNNKFDVTGTTPIAPVDINGTTYNTALRLTIERESVAPFITVGGTIYFNDKKNIGLSIEGGLAYMGKADVTLTSTAGAPISATDVAAETKEIEDNANELKIFPIFKIGLTVSF